MKEETANERAARALDDLSAKSPGYADMDARGKECRDMMEVVGAHALGKGNTLVGMTEALCREVLRLRDGTGRQRFEFRFEAAPQPDSSHNARNCKPAITASVTAETRQYAEYLLKEALGPCSEAGYHYEFKLLSVSGTAVDYLIRPS